MEATFLRTKRVSDPLDDRVKTRILTSTTISTDTSGSDHHDISFHDFEYESESECEVDNTIDDSISDYVHHDHVSQCMLALKRVQHHLLSRRPNPDRAFLHGLQSDVVNAIRSLSGSGLRGVMTSLRRAGYNAGLCKSKWGPNIGLTSSGSYEYVDVEHMGLRYIVDLDFRGQFAVARATEEYKRVVGMLPELVVGRVDEVAEVVEAVEEAARMELKGRGLSVPPWRKRRYVIAKWFGMYRRTTKAVASGGGGGGGGEVGCRMVGFQVAPGLVYH